MLAPEGKPASSEKVSVCTGMSVSTAVAVKESNEPSVAIRLPRAARTGGVFVPGETALGAPGVGGPPTQLTGSLPWSEAVGPSHPWSDQPIATQLALDLRSWGWSPAKVRDLSPQCADPRSLAKVHQSYPQPPAASLRGCPQEPSPEDWAKPPLEAPCQTANPPGSPPTSTSIWSRTVPVKRSTPWRGPCARGLRT